MNEIHHLIQHYGDLFYMVTFLWAALEGETFVIFAGLGAQHGLLNIYLLFLAAWLGSFCGDQAFFVLGRLFGTRILHRFPRLEPKIERALGWIEHYAVAFILSYRFMYGIRNVSSVAVGMSHLSWQKFMLWNLIAAFAWAAAFAGFGYLFGDVIAHLRHREEVVNTGVHQVMMAVLGLFALVVLMRWAMIRFQRDRMDGKSKDKD